MLPCRVEREAAPRHALSTKTFRSMIQRRQSAYLLLGAIALAIVFFLDGIYGTQAAEALVWYVPSLVASGAATVILAVVTIFMYENRQRQQKLVVAVQVLDLIFIVLLAVGRFLTGTLEVFGVGPGALERTLTFVLPVVAYIFFYLARRGIQSDIALIRSMDRLR